MRRAGLVAALALALLLPGAIVARAHAPDADAEVLRADGLPDATAWWSAAGRAGYAPSTEWLGVAYPWNLAGLVRGTWTFDDTRRMPGVRSGPGVAAAHAPLAWFDSLRVARAGGAGAWEGFEAVMVPVSGDVFGTERASGGGMRSMSMFSFQRGSSALEENAISFAGGDSLSELHFEGVSGSRGAVGVYEDAGEHRYGGSLRMDRGIHRFEGRFAHRGSAMEIAGGAAGQSAMGAGASLIWSMRGAHDVTRLELRRATDWHESYGWLIDPSRRDQSEEEAEATWAHDRGNDRLGLRASWWKSHVRRITLDTPEADTKSDGWWLAARGERPLGAIVADAAVGLGAQGGSGGLVVAPSLGFATRRGPYSAMARFERIATPVWSDLAPGVAPFLQDTWTGALTLAAGDSARHARVTGRLGRTVGRAVAVRLPLEELWLRNGYELDPDPYHFALASFEGAWGGHGLGAMLEAFALARARSDAQAAVDPVNGVRVTLEGGRRLFRNELGVRLRVNAAVVGARESEATGAWQSAYVTYGAGGILTIMDVTMVIEAINLEDQPHPLTWIDPRTASDALGPGLETRVTFSWRLFN